MTDEKVRMESVQQIFNQREKVERKRKEFADGAYLRLSLYLTRPMDSDM